MNDYNALFQQHFANICLDIRKLETARVYDQKITPDVITVIADVISDIAPSGQPFSVKSVWNSTKTEDAVTNIFGKPSINNPLANNEYNKFVSQPLSTLYYAGVLAGKKQGAWEYRIANSPILYEIAASEISAINFLAQYAMKILSDSGIGEEAELFFQMQDDNSLDKLEEAFNMLIFKYTRIRNKKEIGRIFPKILNVIAFKRKSRGRIGGHLSRGRITLNDIRYNRINWRDTRKPKEVTRREANISNKEHSMEVTQIKKIIDEVKSFHNKLPEISDSYSGGNVVNAHHIFSKNDYPKLSRMRENIILLTPTQHHSFAHAGNTKTVSGKYQLLCLLKKLDVIEICEIDPNCNFYSVSDFIRMLAWTEVLDISSAKKLLYESKEHADSKDEKKKIIRQVTDDLRRYLTEHYAGN